MADEKVVHIGDNSPEQVAYKLLQDIAKCEGMDLFADGKKIVASREWILSTYAQCLMTVRRPGTVAEHLRVKVPDLVDA